jgi:hypothetical protein
VRRSQFHATRMCGCVLRRVVAARISTMDTLNGSAVLFRAMRANLPPNLRPLTDLLKRRKISQIEYDAALAYFQMNADMRSAVDEKLRDGPRNIVRNVLIFRLGIAEAVTGVASRHSTDVIYRLRGALAELCEAMSEPRADAAEG